MVVFCIFSIQSVFLLVYLKGVDGGDTWIRTWFTSLITRKFSMNGQMSNYFIFHKQLCVMMTLKKEVSPPDIDTSQYNEEDT